jgi:hypothetical protein
MSASFTFDVGLDDHIAFNLYVARESGTAWPKPRRP